MSDKPKRDSSASKRRLREWGRPARPFSGIALLMQVVSVIAWIMIAFGIGHTVDAIASQTAAGGPLLLVIGGALLRGLSGWANDMASAQAGLKMVATARAEIFNRLKTDGARLIEGADPGARTSQIIDRTARLKGYAANWLPGQQMALIGPLVILIAVATQSWLAAAMLLVCVLILPAFIWLTLSEVAAVARAQQASLDALSGAFQSRAAQAGIIRAFRAVARETAALQQASNTLREQTMKVLRVAFLSTAILEFFASISVAMVAVYVGFKLLGVFPFETGETLTLAEGLTILLLVPEFFMPIRKLSSLHHDRADGTASAGFLSDWLDTSASRAPIVRLAKSETPMTIRYQDAGIDFPNGGGLQNITFTARPGNMIALTGASGSGKTTLLKLLIGQGTLASGSISANDQPLQPGESLAESATWLSQTPWMIEGTLAENIRIARPDASDEELRSVVVQVGLANNADAPQVLTRAIGRGGAGLSGGQRQRIGLARLLLRGSPLLLMDEPTTHLDGAAEADFMQTLKAISETRTILIATHAPHIVALCDQAVDIETFRKEVSPC